MTYKWIVPAILCLLFRSCTVSAQDRPIGAWRSHLPYAKALSVATDGSVIYTATDLSMFTYDVATAGFETYSKVEGMSDMDMAAIAYDVFSGYAILGYSNGNIDLFRDNSFYNIPDLKLRMVSGSKQIYHIYTENGYAYISTGLGVLVVDIMRMEIRETYTFRVAGEVLETTFFTRAGDYYYTATNRGVYRTHRSNPEMQIPSSWQQLDSTRRYEYMAVVGEQVYAAGSDSIFRADEGSVSLAYVLPAGKRLTHIDGGADLWVSTFDDSLAEGLVYRLNARLQLMDSFRVAGEIKQVITLPNNSIWFADTYIGLTYVDGEGKQLAVVPPGPKYHSLYGLYASDRDIWMAHGAFNEQYHPRENPYGLSHLNRSERWSYYNIYEYPPFIGSVLDLVAVVKNPTDGSLWFGTMETGLFILHPDKGTHEYLYRNSPLVSRANMPHVVPANSIAPDLQGNMWITQNFTGKELAVRTKEGNWYHFSTPYQRNLPNSAAGLLVDDAGQKWFHAANGPSMVIVYDDNGTLSNSSDDRSRAFTGADNLPGTKVLCMAKDRSGVIWVGTDNGIARINCATQALRSVNCVPELPKVQYDEFVGHLFMEEYVHTIAVDGANRKWVGTNNGVWLLGSDGEKIVYRFTEANSPLPSDIVQCISVDEVTGDVYIGTARGMVSFRSTATAGNREETPLVSFPNPVPPGFRGTIGIRGFTEDADVRITDIAGQLIYRTRALGGQAVWNGMDYTGRRPQSGVYLIFATNNDGSQTQTGKLVIQE